MGRRPALEVGHVHVHDAVEQPERLERVVAARVVDEGNVEAPFHRVDQRLQDLRDHVLGGDEVDVVAASFLEAEHQATELCGRDARGCRSRAQSWLTSQFWQ
jgi:hypothetical protein